MQNLIRRTNTWYARFFIPKERWVDVGKAMGAARGVKKEVVRTLKTSDRREAKRALVSALATIQMDVDAALKTAGLAPLTDWTANWKGRALEWRALISEADDTDHVVPDEYGGEAFIIDSDRRVLLESLEPEAERLEEVRGPAVAQAFVKIATGDHLSLREALDEWLAETGKARRGKTNAGHRKVFSDFEAFLRETPKHQHHTLDSMTFSDVTRRMAGEFIAWRAQKVSAAAVRREFSAPMGLWRWAIRRGHAVENPWTDQTAGLADSRGKDEEDAKRAFTPHELVTLLTASGPEWSPNGGGYGATLWDATRLALLTGLRAAELADLRIKDLTEDHTVVSLPKGKTKNAKRLVPLPKAARRIIEARLAELPDTSPEAPLWPEVPVTKLTNSRGNKLSNRFRVARSRLLSNVEGVDFHSLRRCYATMLETAMNARGRVNPAIIASLMGHARGTMALDLYSSGASKQALVDAVTDLEVLGIAPEVRRALEETASQRPGMVRFQPLGAKAVEPVAMQTVVEPTAAPKRVRRGRKTVAGDPAQLPSLASSTGAGGPRPQGGDHRPGQEGRQPEA
jgi:integrase